MFCVWVDTSRGQISEGKINNNDISITKISQDEINNNEGSVIDQYIFIRIDYLKFMVPFYFKKINSCRKTPENSVTFYQSVQTFAIESCGNYSRKLRFYSSTSVLFDDYPHPPLPPPHHYLRYHQPHHHHDNLDDDYNAAGQVPNELK